MQLKTTRATHSSHASNKTKGTNNRKNNGTHAPWCPYLLLLWGWSEIRLAPVRLLCISIAQKYKTARTGRTFGAKYWSSKMQILDLGIWDIVSLNHGWIKVCIKCFSRLCSIVIPFKKNAACRLWMKFIACNATIWCKEQSKCNAASTCCGANSTQLTGWWLGWPLKAQLLQKSACSGSAVQCSTTIFFLTTAQILLLGFLQRRLWRWEFSEDILRPAVFQLDLSAPSDRQPNLSCGNILQISVARWKKESCASFFEETSQDD